MSDERESSTANERVIDAIAWRLEASPRMRAGLVVVFVSLPTAACSSPHRHETTDRPTISTGAAQGASPTPNAPAPEVAPHDLTPDARAPAAETVRAASEVEALVRRWADERCPPPEGGELPASVPRVEVVLLGPEPALATVATECHATGGYNGEATVVEVRRGRVMPARFETPPRNPYQSADDLLPRPVETGTMSAVWNPDLRVEDGLVSLTSVVLERGLGDVGTYAEWRFVRGRFVLDSIRQRGSTSELTSDVGPFPIVWPRAKRCAARLALESMQRARLVRSVGARELANAFTLEGGARCVSSGPERLACGERPGGASDAYEYLVVSRGQDWVVLRTEGDETEVLRVPRGCELPDDGPR